MKNNFVIDVHTHVGNWGTWSFFDNEIDPFKDAHNSSREACLRYVKANALDYLVVVPLYNPDSHYPFSEGNPLVHEVISGDSPVYGGIWFSPADDVSQYWDETIEMAKQPKVIALKSAPNTWRGNFTVDPATWSSDIRHRMERLIEFAARQNLPLQFHSGGGKSAPHEFEGFVREYGEDVSIHFVHMGLTVQGHFSFVPRFTRWLSEGYRVYCDTSLASSFAIRWLVNLLVERDLQHGFDRIMFASDYPWGAHVPELSKITSLDLAPQIEAKLLGLNALGLYFDRA